MLTGGPPPPPHTCQKIIDRRIKNILLTKNEILSRYLIMSPKSKVTFPRCFFVLRTVGAIMLTFFATTFSAVNYGYILMNNFVAVQELEPNKSTIVQITSIDTNLFTSNHQYAKARITAKANRVIKPQQKSLLGFSGTRYWNKKQTQQVMFSKYPKSHQTFGLLL